MQAEQWQALCPLIFVGERGERFFLCHTAGHICSHLPRAEVIMMVSNVSTMK